jgi:hypothetical protein
MCVQDKTAVRIRSVSVNSSCLDTCGVLKPSVLKQCLGVPSLKHIFACYERAILLTNIDFMF